MDNRAFLFPFIFLTTLISYIISLRKRTTHDHKNKTKLPPGSLGWPYIGETLQLYSQDPNVFFSSRQIRYGEIFKTHVLGCPCVMLASPDSARFVLTTQSHLFKPTYPKSKENLIGPSALFFHQGEYHLRLRKLVKGSLYPEAIRKLVPDIETSVVSALNSWAGMKEINTYNEMKKLSFEVGILAVFGHLEAHYKDELKKNYAVVERGYNSFPTNLPGTRYQKAKQARKRLSEILNKITRERKERKEVEKGLLRCLLDSKDEKGENLSEDQISDNIIGVLFAAQDTTASAITWVIKYLYDNQKLLEAVKVEQKGIYQSNGNGKSGLSWNQTRNMPITNKVILESLRMASIISFTFREAVTDVEYKGYLIPKGWKVMPLFRNIHHNPEFFVDPKKFDPTRFEGPLKPNTFMPFGSGVHACPGNELAKLEMLILIHHLTSQFRYELVGPGSGIQYQPFPIPFHGLPAIFRKEEWTNE
ncbi:Cytochrome P450 CYP4/CYP19/CYP26 subfamily [Handroanthus impetiginosus]|uniref:(+)-abscisic acid 8'-hydroxylase n=1 Tax=Handroanthus impetiginosus TaxID=429701 RepID=A0A2G9I690_9LAMI|nr:Cytochrome P450 CYP4/CYP19/CYP26 subfamily [Handroanthus impetiginosus]